MRFRHKCYRILYLSLKSFKIFFFSSLHFSHFYFYYYYFFLAAQQSRKSLEHQLRLEACSLHPATREPPHLSSFILASSGSSQPRVHSQCASRKVITCPVEAAAPRSRARISPDLCSIRMIFMETSSFFT